MQKYMLSICREEIPCDPCTQSCKVDAIYKKALTTPPRINSEKCIGCKQCIAQCPGQALYYVVEKEDVASISFAYEFVPLPEIGESVILFSEEGNILGNGIVEKADSAKSHNKTCILTVSGEKASIINTRGIKKER